jgi:dolichol-phosphate mannosyltransferase
VPQFSIIVPVYNEQSSLEQLHREIAAVARDHGYDIEIIFVDDGSTDGSWSALKEIAHSDNRVCCLRFRRNFGKASALQAGIDRAVGTYILTLDADLQDDPAELPRLVAALEPDFDLVSGWKKTRHDPLHKTFPSKLFNRLVSWLSGVRLNDHNCGLKLYRSAIFEDFRLYGERHRFIPVLAAVKGWRITELAVNHRPRQHGVSKYNWRRLPKGFLDLITISFLTGFNHRPQHLLGGIGLASFGLGVFGLIWMAIYWALRMTYFPTWEPVHQRPVVIYSMGAMLLGAQLLCMGFLAELIIANNLTHSGTATYSVQEQVGGSDVERPSMSAGDSARRTSIASRNRSRNDKSDVA